MKILMISYTSLLKKLSRSKCEELAKYKDIELCLLIPPFFKELWSKKKLLLEKEETENYDLKVGKVFFPKNLHFSFFYAGLFNALKEFRPDIIDLENEPFNLGTFQVILFKELFSPKSKLIFHTFQNILKQYPFPFNLIEKITYQRADWSFAKNEEAKDILKKKGFKKPISILPPGVDVHYFKKRESKRKELGLKDEFIIGYIGAMVKQKGVATLIEAVAKLKEKVKLILVGDGKYKETLKRKSKVLNLAEKILFLGDIPHQEIPLYLNCFDVLVLPSFTMPNWKEQFGRVLIEAMACEVPVIGSTSGEIPYVIGKGGLVFKENNAEDLKDKLESLIKDKKFRQKLAQKGREQVLEKYSWEIITQKTYQLYKEILEGKT